MKEYLDFENGKIIPSEDNLFSDFDEEGTSNVLENENYIDYDVSKDNFKDVVIDDDVDYDPEYLNKLNVGQKIYLDGNYDYKDITKEKIKPKQKKKKKLRKKKEKIKKEKNIYFVDILNKFFKIVLFFVRTIFLVVLFLAMMLLILYEGRKNDAIKDAEKLSTSEDIIVESIVNSISQENPKEFNDFQEYILNYLKILTEIVNGENLIIDNLKKSIIDKKDAYTYFNKTLTRKEELLRELNLYSYPEDLKVIVNLMKQMIINSENLSKQIMNRYLVNDTSGEIISDMNSYYRKFITDSELIIKYLGDL